MKKRLLRLVAMVTMVLLTVSSVNAVTFNDLTGYQIQKYWSFMTACQPLLAAQNYADYRPCALNALDMASKTTESAAWCTSSNNNIPDFFKKDIVKTDLKPNGIEDYIYDSNGISYVMEGFCSSTNQYSYYTKNCKELGPEYYADKAGGVCAKINQTPVVNPITDKFIAVGKTLTFKVTATDPNGDPIVGYTVNPAPLPTGASFNTITGDFTFTPTAQSVDTIYPLSFTATDGKNISTPVAGKVIVHSAALPTFSYTETAASAKSGYAGTTVVKEFTFTNNDKVRYIVVGLSATTGSTAGVTYVPPAWISSIAPGNTFKIEPNSKLTVTMSITIPAGTNPLLYTLRTAATLKDYANNTSGCSGTCIVINSVHTYALNVLAGPAM